MTEKTEKNKYSKQGFIDAAENSKDRLILQVVLEDNKKYTIENVKSIVDEWKKREVK